MAKRRTTRRRLPGMDAVAEHSENYVQLFDLDFRHRYVNRVLARALNRSPRSCVGKTLVQLGIRPQTVATWTERLERVKRAKQNEKFEYDERVDDTRRSLQTRLAPIFDARGRLEAISAITRDVTDEKRTEALHHGQHAVMRALAGGAALPDLLSTIVRLVEGAAPRRVCSVLQVSEDGQRLVPGYAPHVPPALIEALCSEPFGPGGGNCGAAAFSRKPSVSSNIARDVLWERHRKHALAAGLKACWSHPILAEDGTLLGTFAMYHVKARKPHAAELDVVAQAALNAGIAIQHWRTQDKLLETRDRFETISEYAVNLLAVTDMDGKINYVSASSAALLGFTPEELVGLNLTLGVHHEDQPRAEIAYRKLRDEVGAQIHGLFRYRHKNGGWRVLEVSAKSRHDHRGRYIAVVSGRDVTDREESRRLLQASQERLDRALEAAGLGSWEWDVESGQFVIDDRASRVLGYDPGTLDLTFEKLSAIAHPDDALRIARATEAHLKGETEYLDYDGRVMTQTGAWTWVHSRGRAIRDAKGVPWRVTGTLKNVDAERALANRLAKTDRQMQLLLGATDEGIIGLDPAGIVTFVNPAALKLLGLEEARLLGKNFDEQVRHTAEDGTDLIGHDSPIVHCLLEGQRYVGANELFWRDEQTSVPVEYTVSPLIEDGRPSGAVLVFRDVSEKRTLARQLQHQALHDPLTGLINRRGFEKKLSSLLQSARTQNREHALCYVDLDHFKLVNDTCGHAAGDELLRQLPVLLGPLVRKTDAIARLGGDEFAILLEDCQLEQAARIAESVRNAIRDFRFVWQYRAFTIGASIGVVGVSAASQGLVSVLSAADAACYVAKDQGPNTVHVSYPHDLAIIRRRGEMRWVARIKTALEENQFRLHYMSIAELAGGEPVRHHELLLRLADAKGGLILPGQFLPAAERYQLMPQVDRWVIEHALTWIGRSAAAVPALREHRFGINLSGESLRDPQLLDFIRKSLELHAVPPSMVYFELTETAAIANLGAAVDFMRGLKKTGCQLALDDFGSGMSSFAYLKHLPVDFLKIDGSFIKDIVDNPVDQAIVRAVQAVGLQMGITTVAEYVESDKVKDALKAMGIHYGQGYAIAKPASLDEFPLLKQTLAASA